MPNPTLTAPCPSCDVALSADAFEGDHCPHCHYPVASDPDGLYDETATASPSERHYRGTGETVPVCPFCGNLHQKQPTEVSLVRVRRLGVDWECPRCGAQGQEDEGRLRMRRVKGAR